MQTLPGTRLHPASRMNRRGVPRVPLRPTVTFSASSVTIRVPYLSLRAETGTSANYGVAGTTAISSSAYLPFASSGSPSG
jgi:hypothetical protein